MIHNPNDGYWDYSNEIAPQWIEYGDPGARSAPGTINVGGMGSSPSITGAGGMPVGGSNPILTSGTPGASTPKLDADYYFNAQFAPDFLRNSQGAAYPNPIFSANQPNPNPNSNPNPNPNSSQFTPNPFMTPGMTFQPRTQFGQQASAPLNINQQGRTYGQMPGGPNMAQQPPAFQSVRPGGSSGFMPQFQNPFGPQTQPQQYRSMGQQPTQISQQPQAPRQPDADGIAALLRNAMQNR
jgi:hypothetical protein